MRYFLVYKCDFGSDLPSFDDRCVWLNLTMGRWPTSAKLPTIFNHKNLYAFLREFYLHPVLYNTKHPLYHDRREKFKHCILIARKLGIPGLNGHAIKREIQTFRRNYIKKLREFLQKKKEDRRFSASDWWYITDKFYRDHVFEWKPELKALYVDCLYPGGEPRPKSPEDDRMAGVPPNWGAGVPVRGSGEWRNPTNPQFIEVDTDETKEEHLPESADGGLDKIKAAMMTSNFHYGTKEIKAREQTQFRELPVNYRCHKCNEKGHWIKDCGYNQKMAGIPMWGAGIPKRGWGGWHMNSEPIDVDALDTETATEVQVAKPSEHEQTAKKAKELEARGPPTRMTPQGPFPFLIDSFNYRRNHHPEALEPANSKYHWNRLTIIGGAKVPKDKLLNAVVKSAAPCLLIPALYQIDGDDSFFLFREGLLINRLMDKSGHKLAIQDSNLEKALEINFLIQYVSVEDEPLNPAAALASAINRRLNVKNGEVTLDLRNFQNDPEFKNLYVTFKTPRLMAQVMNHVHVHRQRLRTLLLSHNELDRLDVVDFLYNGGDKPDLKVLDLRHNKLTYSGFERVASLKSWRVQHILIEGNPICEDYETPGETMYEIRKMIPSIKRLDGVDLDFVLDNRVSFKFYTRNPGYATFVDHFFHHYYSFLETDKDKLVQMYDSKACMTFSVCQNDRTPVPGNFFNPSNRNLISMSNITKSYDNAFIGKTRIFDALAMMPNLKFDTYSFNIDFPHAFQNGTMLISCTGAFTLPDEPSQQIYTFARACILQVDSTVGCWKITNDMWTMMNALPPPNSKCFKLAKRAVKGDFAVMLNPLTKDKDVLKRVIADLTHMKSAWVEKYLSDSGWDLECTLLSFIDHFKSHLIPSEAFLPMTAGA